jgi:hypothetical protein
MVTKYTQVKKSAHTSDFLGDSTVSSSISSWCYSPIAALVSSTAEALQSLVRQAVVLLAWWLRVDQPRNDFPLDGACVVWVRFLFPEHL